MDVEKFLNWNNLEVFKIIDEVLGKSLYYWVYMN